VLTPRRVYPAQLGRVSLEIVLRRNSAYAHRPARSGMVAGGCGSGRCANHPLDLITAPDAAWEPCGGSMALCGAELAVDFVECGHVFYIMRQASKGKERKARRDQTRPAYGPDIRVKQQ
jgi:hypothetical protein